MEEQILDVTQIEPRLKHKTIFDLFDNIQGGESFIINNDHDPKPLYYQLNAEKPEQFTWQYLENGPETWKVRIGKPAEQAPEKSIGEIVAGNYRTAQVFKSFGIDFCCGGKKRPSEVCAQKGLDLDELMQSLAVVEGQTQDRHNDFSNWDLGFLCDYVVNTHHRYVAENTQFIYELAHKVARVHGPGHPELVEIARIYSELVPDLQKHFALEEAELFPYIKRLSEKAKAGEKVETGKLDLKAIIEKVEGDHDEAGNALRNIRDLSSNYSLPEGACASYTILFKKLEEFEDDLHQHVHIENNIIIPKALATEQRLASNK